MLTVLSPAKTLDFDNPAPTRRSTQPRFLAQSAALIEDARELSPEDIRELMGVSENIAELNFRRFHNWATPFDRENAKQALFAFRGDVYTGLDADSLDSDDIAFAQQHLRILSGLYGLLRPLDLMQPYRLEMGLKFSNRGGPNLYAFWGGSLTRSLNSELGRSGSQVLVNLASNEYFRALQPKDLNADLVTPVFKDLKNGKYKVISFYAKKARGQMARFIVRERLDDPRDLFDFAVGGYRYNAELSSANEPVFTRDQPLG